MPRAVTPLHACGLAALSYLAVSWWLRRHPSPMPYAQRFFVELPHPLITRSRLREILEPRQGERILEIGPGTGYYTLTLAEWVGPQGHIDILDVQQEFLDHTTSRAAARGTQNVTATFADAQALPFGDDSFDGAVLITVLGEIPDQEAALRELRRVLRPSGRLVVGEQTPPDPHMVTFGRLRSLAERSGFVLERRVGPPFGYFARFAAA